MLAKRKLGTQGLEVSEIGLGSMGMSQAYGTPDDAESITVEKDFRRLDRSRADRPTKAMTILCHEVNRFDFLNKLIPGGPIYP
ncbi:MAG TPA: hypothetical protein VGC39_01110 [Candidatus Methylacidiphilales bacterium]